MANPAVAVLESALRARKLDRTLTTALAPLEPLGPAALVPSGLYPLDGRLGGGLPRGHLSELVATGMPGASADVGTAGRTTMLLQMMAAATRRGEIVALIDVGDALDVGSAAAAGIDLDRLLWIRGTALISAPSPTVDRALDRGLKALTLVLQAGGFGLVAIDLTDIPLRFLKQLPATTWLRVQRAVEGSDTACVLLAPAALARSAGGVTLSLSARPAWAGTGDRSRRLAGLDLRASIVSPRRRVEGEVSVEAVVSDVC